MKILIPTLALLIVLSFTQGNVQAQPQPIHTFQIESEGRILGLVSSVFSYDGTKLAAGTGSTAEGNIWDVRSGQLITNLQIPIDGRDRPLDEINWLQFSLDGSLLVGGGTSSGPGAVVVVWNAETGEIVQRFILPNKHNNTFPNLRASGAVITPGNRQALIGNEGELSLWDISTGKLLQDSAMLGQTKPEFENVSSVIKFFPDGQRIAVFDRKRGFIILNWQTDEFLHGFTGSNVQFSSDFKSVFVQRTPFGLPREIKVWDADTGEIVNEFTIDVPDGTSIRFAPNRTMFVRSGGILNVQRVLPSKAVENVLMITLPDGVEPVNIANQMQFSPDGEYFLVTSGRKAVLYRVADFATGIPNAAVYDN